MNLGSDTIAVDRRVRHIRVNNAFGNHGTNLMGGVSGIDLDTNGTIDVVGLPGAR